MSVCIYTYIYIYIYIYIYLPNHKRGSQAYVNCLLWLSQFKIKNNPFIIQQNMLKDMYVTLHSLSQFQINNLHLQFNLCVLQQKKILWYFHGSSNTSKKYIVLLWWANQNKNLIKCTFVNQKCHKTKDMCIPLTSNLTWETVETCDMTQ